MRNSLDKRHASRATVALHDGRIERNPPIAVRPRAEANGHVRTIELHHIAARLNGVER